MKHFSTNICWWNKTRKTNRLTDTISTISFTTVSEFVLRSIRSILFTQISFFSFHFQTCRSMLTYLLSVTLDTTVSSAVCGVKTSMRWQYSKIIFEIKSCISILITLLKSAKEMYLVVFCTDHRMWVLIVMFH